MNHKTDAAEHSVSTDCYVPHPLRLQRKRTKGFKLPPGTICVTRPGPWGNPFRMQSAIEAGYANTEAEARALCVECFEDWLLKGDLSEWWFGASRDSWLWMRENLSTLASQKVACFCPLNRPCHADVLAKWAPMACPF